MTMVINDITSKSHEQRLIIKEYIHTVHLTTKFTKKLMSSDVPRHTSKITRGLFSNARVLQRTYIILNARQ